jgi:putative copper export protein
VTIALFLHLVGISLWLGGGVAVLLLGAAGAAGAAEVTVRGRADRLALLSRVYGMVVAPGAVLATASGIALTMLVYSRGLSGRLGTAAVGMETLGLLAGVLEIFFTFPAAQRLGRVIAAADPADARAGERLRGRIALMLRVTLALVVIAILLGVVPPPE